MCPKHPNSDSTSHRVYSFLSSPSSTAVYALLDRIVRHPVWIPLSAHVFTGQIIPTLIVWQYFFFTNALPKTLALGSSMKTTTLPCSSSGRISCKFRRLSSSQHLKPSQCLVQRVSVRMLIPGYESEGRSDKGKEKDGRGR
ncbi:hypothetical protein GYMLUDRAFT_560043 [Collybiopsis luxurians FD-317 M1]|uniref:Uncharacterized protein n=1 Tax=Collybiopsis luxurians FD-317 M1 TaxID=944289 RepID=A0A0D0CH15_9AGAR|nr:hypothetical protein GYMLUDRAFT_560043 [Collybiopsis luxurians FD-317 M1]